MPANNAEQLPITPHLDAIADALAAERLLLLNAETGAGKTTLVPWRLLSHSSFAGLKMLLLQPRRIAARAAAERIAELLGEEPGGTVGLRTRYETIIGRSTRLEVVTEGVLTRIIQNDQSLAGYGAVIFDEFHERNLQADLGLALALDSRRYLRPDLALLFMSATPDAGGLLRLFSDLRQIDVAGRAHPVTVQYRRPLPGEKPWDGAARLALEARGLLDASGGGDVLVFLPGFREIFRTRDALARLSPGIAPRVVLLHGQLPPEEQRRVLRPTAGAGDRVILSTNVAETSLTIPGVCAVVDSGLERRVRFQARTGMDHRDTVPVSMASAAQRAGRAGRTGPGICLRWWAEGEGRESFSPPEILEADLAPLVLETALWGAPPADLDWLTAPPPAALQRAMTLLRELLLIDDQFRITEAGRRAAALGLHPRLGRMVLEAAGRGWLVTAAVTAAILEEGDRGGAPGDADFRDRIAAVRDRLTGGSGPLSEVHARRVIDEARRILGAAGGGRRTPAPGELDPGLAGRLLALAYPDRVAGRAAGSGGDRWVLVSGRGARMKGTMDGAPFVAAAEIDGGDIEARIYLAAPLTADDIDAGFAGEPLTERIVTWDGWTPRVRSVTRLGRLVLRERAGGSLPDADLRVLAHERLNREGMAALPSGEDCRIFLARWRFVQRTGVRPRWPDAGEDALAADIDQWILPFAATGGGPLFTEETVLAGLRERLGREGLRELESLAPERIALPAGTMARVDYLSGDAPVVAGKIQEFFGCRETPRLCGAPVLLHLLSPARRPVQVTADLDGFWDRAYPAVKKELMGRYPRHHWPEDPRAAVPTARAKPRK